MIVADTLAIAVCDKPMANRQRNWRADPNLKNESFLRIRAVESFSV
jgi:hypothetical protein